MKAVISNEPGALQIAELPSPAPGPGQLRICVQAAAVNPVDLATRDGHLSAAGLVAGWPLALGWDVAGVVDALGPDVDDLALGDAVIGIRNVLSAPGGTHAESVVLDRDAVARAPLAATPAEASTLPLNGLTAVQALDLVALAPGQTLLVTGAAARSAATSSSSARCAACTSSQWRRRATRRCCASSGHRRSWSARSGWERRSAPSCRAASPRRSTPP